MVRVIRVAVSRIGSVALQKVSYKSDNIEKAKSDAEFLSSVRLGGASEFVPPDGYETVIFEAWPPMYVQVENGMFRASTMFAYGFLPVGLEVNQDALDSNDTAIMWPEVRRLEEIAIGVI